MGWKDSVTENDIDQQISSGKIPGAHYNQVIITHDKLVIVEEVFKKPVPGKKIKLRLF